MAATPEREVKKLRKELTELSGFVKSYLVLLDEAMSQPESHARGQRIAQLSNKLELRNDMVRRFVLELDINGKPRKRKPSTHRE